ncbi:MAG: hypothetical protein U0169_12735 [Polyangiaceae bacterium]
MSVDGHEKDPERLLAADGDAFGTRLLRSAKEDRMPDTSKAALLVALSGAATIAGTATSPVAVSHVGTSFGWGAKAGIVGLAVALVAGSAAFVATRDDARDAVPSSASSAPVGDGTTRAPHTTFVEAPPSTSVATPAVVVHPGETAPDELGVRRTPAPTRTGTVSPAAAPSVVSASPGIVATDSLAAETAALAEARARLRGADPAGALAELDAFRAAHPRPVLGDEATVLRVEALAAKGDLSAARALGEPWLARHPSNAYASRVRRALGSTP